MKRKYGNVEIDLDRIESDNIGMLLRRITMYIENGYSVENINYLKALKTQVWEEMCSSSTTTTTEWLQVTTTDAREEVVVYLLGWMEEQLA